MSDRILTAADALRRAHPGKAWPCCEWVARIVRDAYGLPHADGSLWWRAMNVWDTARPWSPATESLPIAESITWADDDGAVVAGRWHLCQSWRRLTHGTVGPGDSGHTWLWYATSPTHGVVLDSSTTRGPRLGGVAYTGQPMPAGRPWAERVAAYPAGVAVAVLRP